MDATQAPDPLGGWSTTIRSVPDAVVNHVQAGYLVHPSGVFDASGRYVHEAVLWRGRPLMVPPPLPETPAYQPGRWMWAGPLHAHFGHFLTESTGRLWALERLEKDIDGIVFLPGAPLDPAAGAPELTGFQRAFLDLLDLRVPVRVLDRPTRFEHLEVPGQGFGIGPLAGGTAPFRAFIRNRFARSVAPDGPQRLYISRAKLGADFGGILGEKRLQTYLEQAGYAIFHPQLQSLTEQIACYKAARLVVAPDGSALHLLAMVARPDLRVAVIRRRLGPGANGILQQLADFTGTKPLVIDAILGNWIRSDRKRVDNFSFGEVDFAAVGQRLAETGFVAQAADWTALPAARPAKLIRNIEATLSRRKLTFRLDR
ncbi:glycosyltransferase family 61 protein [Rhodobacter sp. Har01]|uniref:glycosyltransferase family 61 protein n=1 Tax=Rhodobacter sp. Har01 TaxID=2883999 RepID=UPI001D06260C|nr:glycosyltransferase family 61 protein [Rhodobacter sp. Har01]MCB6176728.1 glycosyltransferase family 61 protein [Rhodobacter sp. Har01]